MAPPARGRNRLYRPPLLPLLLALCALSLAHQSAPMGASDAPNEDQRQRLDQVVWWKKTNFYHIYLRSFKDSSGDGNGDLRGVIEKLDYLSQIGVGTLLMTPFYSSPMRDCGYDIDNYEAIQPLFGSMQDFEDLLRALKARNMRMVVDFVPNHTSDLHPWFYCSERALLPEFAKECAKYADYYVWRDARKNSSWPTEWSSVFGGGPAWSWSDVRQQFYLHQFLPQQPDLNFYNPQVREEFKRIARFWLRKGADGLRVDSANYLLEDTLNWTENPPNPDWRPGDDPFDKQLHTYTRSLPGSAELVNDWREVANEPEFAGQHKVIITEAYDAIPKLIEYYGRSPAHKLADLPFNFQLLKLDTQMTAGRVEQLAMDWIASTRALGWPDEQGAMAPWIIWVTGNHDNKRMANRLGVRRVTVTRWISYFLPGVPVNYYGDELPLHDSKFNSIPKSTVAEGEPSRLPYRAPMAWNPKPGGGFSSAPDLLWMPVNPDWRQNNVETLLSNSSGPFSHLKLFIELQKLRQDHLGLFVFGDCVFFPNSPADSDSVLAIGRTHPTLGNLLLLANLDQNNDLMIRLKTAAKSAVRAVQVEPPTAGQILMVNFVSLDRAPQVQPQARLDQLEGLVMAPFQALILKY